MRNLALATFLRSRRERLAPQDVGLPKTSRRRVGGLRREEVAILADLGIVWYTWLEQGRPIRVSPDAIDRIIVALRLSAVEADYLRVLTEANVGAPPAWKREVTSVVRDLIEGYVAGPAYVLSPRWDVVSWNASYARLYERFGEGAIAPHNMIRLSFTNEVMRAMLTDWPTVARAYVGMFRADYAPFVGDPDFEALVADVCAASPDFAALWSENEVDSPTRVVTNEVVDGNTRVTHRIVTLAIPQEPGYTTVFHVPEHGYSAPPP